MIYGVCISDVKTWKDNAEIEKFLDEFAEKDPDVVQDYRELKAEYEANGDAVYGFMDLVKDFDDGLCYGLAAFIAYVIRTCEDIDIDSCDGAPSYIGIIPDVPWCYNDKTRNLTETEYQRILAKYIGYFTDETLVINWYDEDGE